MGSLFAGPSLPKVAETPAAPKVEDPAVQAAAAKERKLLRLRKGRQSTILTSLSQQTGGAGKQLTGQ